MPFFAPEQVLLSAGGPAAEPASRPNAAAAAAAPATPTRAPLPPPTHAARLYQLSGCGRELRPHGVLLGRQRRLAAGRQAKVRVGAWPAPGVACSRRRAALRLPRCLPCSCGSQARPLLATLCPFACQVRPQRVLEHQPSVDPWQHHRLARLLARPSPDLLACSCRDSACARRHACARHQRCFLQHAACAGGGRVGAAGCSPAALDGLLLQSPPVSFVPRDWYRLCSVALRTPLCTLTERTGCVPAASRQDSIPAAAAAALGTARMVNAAAAVVAWLQTTATAKTSTKADHSCTRCRRRQKRRVARTGFSDEESLERGQRVLDVALSAGRASFALKAPLSLCGRAATQN